MPIAVPGRHAAHEPLGRLRSSPFQRGRKSGFMELNLTAMVDMFTVIVIFLLQSFSGADAVSVQEGLTLPRAEEAAPIEHEGAIVVILHGSVTVDGKRVTAQALTDELRARRLEKERQAALVAEIARGDVAPFEGHLLVQADESTDFEVIRGVVESAQAAGWVRLNFLVLPSN